METGNIVISKTPEFEKICSRIRYLIRDRNLRPEAEQPAYTNKNILGLFKEADEKMGLPQNIFIEVLGCESWDGLPKVLATQYLLYTVLRSSMGVSLDKVS